MHMQVKAKSKPHARQTSAKHIAATRGPSPRPEALRRGDWPKAAVCSEGLPVRPARMAELFPSQLVHEEWCACFSAPSSVQPKLRLAMSV